MSNNDSTKRRLSIEQMGRLVEMSDTHDRPEIAKEMNVTKQTIWKYQRQFKLI